MSLQNDDKKYFFEMQIDSKTWIYDRATKQLLTYQKSSIDIKLRIRFVWGFFLNWELGTKRGLAKKLSKVFWLRIITSLQQ